MSRGTPEGFLSIQIEKSFTPSCFAEGRHPTKSGFDTAYKSFRVRKVTLRELVSATYAEDGLPETVVEIEVTDAEDLHFCAPFSGSLSTFPNVPDKSEWSLKDLREAPDIFDNWQTVNAGIPVSVNFKILESVIYRFQAPAGYDPVPRFITVGIYACLSGPVLLPKENP